GGWGTGGRYRRGEAWVARDRCHHARSHRQARLARRQGFDEALVTSPYRASGKARRSRGPALAADDPDQVEDDQDVDGKAGRLERAWAVDELVDLERNQQRGGDHGQPLGPAFAPNH